MNIKRLEFFTALAGFCLVSLGAWIIYMPAGLIVSGTLILFVSLFGDNEK